MACCSFTHLLKSARATILLAGLAGCALSRRAMLCHSQAVLRQLQRLCHGRLARLASHPRPTSDIPALQRNCLAGSASKQRLQLHGRGVSNRPASSRSEQQATLSRPATEVPLSQQASPPAVHDLEERLGPFSTSPTLSPPPPLVIIISGPSGVGKDAVINQLRARRPDIHFVVTATSRCDLGPTFTPITPLLRKLGVSSTWKSAAPLQRRRRRVAAAARRKPHALSNPSPRRRPTQPQAQADGRCTEADNTAPYLFSYNDFGKLRAQAGGGSCTEALNTVPRHFLRHDISSDNCQVSPSP